MKMTLVISTLNAGGAERVMSVLANAWAEKEGDVSLITFEQLDYQPFYKLSPLVQLVNLDLLNRGVKGKFCRIWRVLKRLYILRQTLKQQKPDCIISFMDTVNITTIFANLGLKIPIIISERVDPHFHSIGFFKDLLRRVSYPLASHIVVQTTQVLNYFSKSLHQKMSIIPNPVMSPSTNDAPNINYDSKKIIAIGRLEPQKGFDILLKAFAKALAKEPEWELFVWGEGKERAQLEHLIRTLEIGKQAFLPGITQNIYQEISKASLFVLSSRYEGFPNTLCEAMASGLPVIAFDCGSGPKDIIRHEVDGILIKDLNDNALAESMVKLMQNAALRKQYGNHALEITTRFSLEEILAKWDAVRIAACEKENV